jgi:capsid protein
VLAGAIDLPGFASRPGDFTVAKWIPPRWDWIDPLKDLQAEKLAVDAGFKARSDVIEAQGYDAEETDARISADRDREEALGLSFAAGAGETQGARATPDQPEEPPDRMPMQPDQPPRE